jgi:hypothetical protein
MAARGEVVFGGCLISELDPTHVCPRCGVRLLRFEDDEFVLWAPPTPLPWSLESDGPLVH